MLDIWAKANTFGSSSLKRIDQKLASSAGVGEKPEDISPDAGESSPPFIHPPASPTPQYRTTFAQGFGTTEDGLDFAAAGRTCVLVLCPSAMRSTPFSFQPLPSRRRETCS